VVLSIVENLIFQIVVFIVVIQIIVINNFHQWLLKHSLIRWEKHQVLNHIVNIIYHRLYLFVFPLFCNIFTKTLNVYCLLFSFFDILWLFTYFSRLLWIEIIYLINKCCSRTVNVIFVFIGDSGVTKGEANGQLPISFGDLPIEIFLFQNYLFIFELDSNCIFFSSTWITHALFACPFCEELTEENRTTKWQMHNCIYVYIQLWTCHLFCLKKY